MNPSAMSDREALEQARVVVLASAGVQVERDARIVRLSDPPGVAVEAWVYLMDEGEEQRLSAGAF